MKSGNIVKLPVSLEPDVEGSVNFFLRDIRTSVEEAHNKALGYALHIGSRLLDLRDVCKRHNKSFRDLFPKTDDERQDPKKLPFNRQNGYKLMTIAENQCLSHERHSVPSDWNSLYQLARIPAPKLKKLIKSNAVGPEMSRAQATTLARQHTVSTKAATQFAKTKKIFTRRDKAYKDYLACLKKLNRENQIAELRDLADALGFTVSLKDKL